MKNAGFVFLLIAIALAASAPGTAQSGQDTILQKIIVRVNGEIFTQTDLEFRQIEAIRQRQQGRDPSQLDAAQLRSLLAEVTPGLLLEAVHELMLVQHGRELGFTLTDEQFTQALESLKAQYDFDDAELEEAMAQEGLTLTKYRALLERQAIMGQVRSREIMPQMNLTEAETRQYYAAHPEEFTDPVSVTLREIFVAVPSEMLGGEAVVNVAANDAAREKALAARARLIAGEDPATVVADVSEAGSKANGGLVGPVSVNQLDPALAQVVEALEPEQTSEPVRKPTGFQVVTLISRTQPETRPFEAVRQQVMQKIFEERETTEVRKFLDRIRGLALIEWKDEQYKQMYEEALATQLAGT